MNASTGHSRRGMVIALAAGVIPAAGGALLAAQWTEDASARAGGGEGLAIRSGPGFVPHAHDLLITFALLRAPPGHGVVLTTTHAMFHTHDVALTQAQLRLVALGGTVTTTGGSHTFVIALARAMRVPSFPPGPKGDAP